MSNTSASGRELPLFDEPLPEERSQAASEPAAPARREEPLAAPLRLRLGAGLLDLAVQAGVALVLVGGLLAMGVRPGWRLLPALVVVLLVFSFLYTVIPLAFWGRTPGMAWRGLVSRSLDGERLTFAQTWWRWLGGVLTVASLGAALLAALEGDGLADRLSGSRTWLARRRPLDRDGW